MADSRLCAADASCVGYDRRTRQPAAVRGGMPLCWPCLTRAAADVRALAEDYTELGAELAPGPRSLGARVANAGEELGAPLATGVEALRRSIWWAVTVWEPPVREVAGLPPERTRGVRESWAVGAATKVLARWTPALAMLGPTWGYAEGLDAGPVERDGLWAVDDLRRLHRQARAVCGLTRRTYHLPGDCSRCGASALLRIDGSDTVRCGVCNQEWSHDDYRRYVTLVLAQIGAG